MTIVLLSVLGVFAAGLLPAAPTPSCAEAVLNDWYDGALERTYEPQCYRAALEALPEDVRVYTTAVDDISRALRQRLTQDRAAAAPRGARSLSGVRRPSAARKPAAEAAPVAVGETSPTRRPPVPLLLLVGLVLTVLLVATGTVVSRRVRRTRAGP